MEFEDGTLSGAAFKRRRVDDSDSGAPVSVAGALAPAALYAQLDKQMTSSRKRRSNTGYVNVTALDAIVGLAASGYFTPKAKKRKQVAPPQTALGFISVPQCPPTKRGKRGYRYY